MGAVRVEIELASLADQVLVREGIKRPDEVRRMKVTALVDTGAVKCVVPQFVADTLGVARPFREVAEFADGRRQEVDVTEPVLMMILGRPVYEECLVLGDEVLIGQTALEKTDLHVDCREGKVVPNPAHPDQPVIKIKGVGRRWGQV